MKENPKSRKLQTSGSQKVVTANLTGYTREYMMDPTRMKETLKMLNPDAPCVQIIKDIVSEQLEYIRKSERARRKMERNIVRILKNEKYRHILLK